MIKILFVCHGNICRSPMAEFVMKKLVSDAGLSDRIYIESAATSTEELGNSVYPPARKKLASVGINCDGKTARQTTICRISLQKLVLDIHRVSSFHLLYVIMDSQSSNTYERKKKCLKFSKNSTTET